MLLDFSKRVLLPSDNPFPSLPPPKQVAGASVAVGDFLLTVNGADVSKLRPDDLIRVLQATQPPRTFKFLRLGRGPGPGGKGPVGPAPPSNAIVFTVQVCGGGSS